MRSEDGRQQPAYEPEYEPIRDDVIGKLFAPCCVRSCPEPHVIARYGVGGVANVSQSTSHKNKDRSFHYLPYRTDSGFEQTFLKEVLSFDEIENLGLEVYYNGDRAMTEFKIKCYKKNGSKWSYVGIYTPDFLIIKRKDGKIHKIIVVETKGEIYAKDPTFKDKKIFMETEFSKQNNTAFGYERFDYLYLEDTLPEKDRMTLTRRKICEFFKEES